MFGRATITLGIGPHSSWLSSARLLRQQATRSYTSIIETKLVTVKKSHVFFYFYGFNTKSYLLLKLFLKRYSLKHRLMGYGSLGHRY